MTLTLPWPPTVNTYYRNVGGRMLISAKGRQYRANALAAIVEQGSPKLKGEVSVKVEAHLPDMRKRDLDNICKGILDSLTHGRVIEDDSLVGHLALTKVLPSGNPRVVLTIEPWRAW